LEIGKLKHWKIAKFCFRQFSGRDKGTALSHRVEVYEIMSNPWGDASSCVVLPFQGVLYNLRTYYLK